jgi:hypothetical protein
MKDPESHPSPAKAALILLTLSARINPCPFKTATNEEFSASREVVPFRNGVHAAASVW